MNTTTARPSTTTTAPATLRQRIAQLSQAHAMKDIQARANPASVPMHIAQRATTTVPQRIEASILQQAKNNLATANFIGQHNKRLGNALKGMAMGDMNSLRAKGITARKSAVTNEYNNLGTYWNA